MIVIVAKTMPMIFIIPNILIIIIDHDNDPTASNSRFFTFTAEVL